jgi:hypothetical protein
VRNGTKDIIDVYNLFQFCVFGLHSVSVIAQVNTI